MTHEREGASRMDMKGKNVVLGVTGGIAAYRAADIARH